MIGLIHKAERAATVEGPALTEMPSYRRSNSKPRWCADMRAGPYTHQFVHVNKQD